MSGPPINLDDLLGPTKPQTPIAPAARIPAPVSAAPSVDDLLGLPESPAASSSTGEDQSFGDYALHQVLTFFKSIPAAIAGFVPIQAINSVVSPSSLDKMSSAELTQHRDLLLSLSSLPATAFGDTSGTPTPSVPQSQIDALNARIIRQRGIEIFQRAEQARRKAGLPTRTEIRNEQRSLALLSRDPTDPAWNRAGALPGEEPSQAAEALYGFTPQGLVEGIVRPFEEAVTDEDFARASAGATVITAAILSPEAHGVTAKGYRASVIADARARAAGAMGGEAAASTPNLLGAVQHRVLGDLVQESLQGMSMEDARTFTNPEPPSSELPVAQTTPVPPPSRVMLGIQRLSNVEQQLAIQQRLLDEAAGNTTAAIIKAHNDLKPFGTTVIPGVERVGDAVRRAKQLNPDLNIAIYDRGNGISDIAVYGKNSPLTNPEFYDQFTTQGFFEGQEVFYNGRPAVYRDRVQVAGGENFALITPFGEEGDVTTHVPFNEIRRPPYTDVAEPLVFETRRSPLTIPEVIEYLGAKKAGTVTNALRITAGQQLLDQYVRTATSQPIEGVTSEQATGVIGLQPGISALPMIRERMVAMNDAGLPLDVSSFSEPTLHVFADANGKPVAAMVTDLAYDPAGGTYKSEISGGPAQKYSLSIMDYAYDLGASEFTLGRASLALADEARRLGVTQVNAEIDAASARVLARVVNKYVQRVETTHARARVGEASVASAELVRDFNGYLDNAMRSAKTAARMSGVDLSKTKVVGADGEPRRMYHGTTKSYDDLSLDYADPDSWPIQGFFFSSDSRVAGGIWEGTQAKEPGYAGTEAGGYRAFADPLQSQRLAEQINYNDASANARVLPQEKSGVNAGLYPVIWDTGERPNVRVAYLDIRNPLVFEAPAEPGLANFLKSKLPDNLRAAHAPQFDDFTRRNPNATNQQLLSLVDQVSSELVGVGRATSSIFNSRQLLLEYGHDGLTYKGGNNVPMLDENGAPIQHDVWVAFKPEQVISPWVSGALSFDRIVQQFAKERGFLPEESAYLQRFLEQQIGKERRELYLTPEEQALYNKTVKELTATLGGEPRPLVAVHAMKKLPLSVAASTNNVSAEWTPNGVVEVRARDAANTLLGSFRSEGAAKTFINALGQTIDAPPLDGGGVRNDVAPGSIVGGSAPPPPQGPADVASGMPPNTPPDPLNVSWLPHGDRIKPAIIDYLAQNLPLLFEYDRVVNGYDTRPWGTQFSNGVRALMNATRQLDTARYPSLVELHGIDKELAAAVKAGGKRSPSQLVEQARLHSRYQETMPSDQIVSEGFFRPLNSAEINAGNWLAAHEIDNAKVLEFVRRRDELQTRLKDKPTELANEVAALTQEFNLDRDHAVAAGLFNAVRDVPIEEAYIGHIVRYADAKLLESQGFDLSQEAFAKENGITSREVVALKRLEDYSSKIADMMGFPKYRRIRRWLPHFAAYGERGTMPESAFLGQRGLNNVPEINLLSDLARTGELSNWTMDPVLANLRYTNAAFRAKYLNPVMKQVVADWAREYAKVPEGSRGEVQRTLLSFLGNVRGTPLAIDTFLRHSVDEILSGHGIVVSSDVARNITNALTSTISLKYLGFRPIQGLRDFTTGISSAYSSFGAGRTLRMLKLGFDATASDIALLHSKGAIPTAMTPLSFESPATLLTTATAAGHAFELGAKAGSKYAAIVNQLADWGMKGSLQTQVNARWHAGAYLEAHELMGSVALDLASGKITEGQAYRRLDLDMYPPPVVRQIQELLNNGKYEDAAHVYGQETGKIVQVAYGVAAHPRGWNSTYGRLFTTFGRFASWNVARVGELASRGSARARTVALTRFAVSQAATYTALAGLGIAGYNWLLVPGLTWVGGPFFTMLGSLKDMMSSSPRARQEGWQNVKRTLNPTPLVVNDIFDGLRVTNADEDNSPSNPFESIERMSGARIRKEPSMFDYIIQ